MISEQRKKDYVLLVIPSSNFSWCEYDAVRQVLEKDGCQVYVVSDNSVEATADNGEVITVDGAPEIIDVSQYDGLFFIGGVATIECLDIPAVHRLVRDARDMGIAYGAIDLAVRVLAYADGLVGKSATGLNEDGKLNLIFETHGARYRPSKELRSEDRNIVIDGIIVTAQGPDDAQAYAQGILKVLHKEDAGIVDDPTRKRVIE